MTTAPEVLSCPACGLPPALYADPDEPCCNPYTCPAWEVTHAYDIETRTWVPESSTGAFPPRAGTGTPDEQGGNP